MTPHQRKPPRARSAVRIGTDLVSVSLVAESLDKFGSRYSQRVFTAGEIEYCERSPSERARRFAARFAAKEATLKVLRPRGHWLDWRDIEVIRTPGGWCGMQLHGPARLMARRQGILDLSVSLSHEQDYALAVVAGTFD